MLNKINVLTKKIAINRATVTTGNVTASTCWLFPDDWESGKAGVAVVGALVVLASGGVPSQLHRTQN